MKTTSTKPIICFFGTYKKNYARTSTIREALMEKGYQVVENNIEIPDERLELPEDFTFQTTLRRIFRKLKAEFQLISNRDKFRMSDVIFTLHPGHLDLPIAKFLSILYKKPLVFDSSISPYDIMFVGRSIANKNSLKAKLVWGVEWLALRLPNKILVDTRLMKQFLIDTFQLPEEKIIVLPLGANDTIYFPEKKESNKTSPVEVFFFGLFNPMHGLPFILEAMKILKKDSDIHFSILGDGYLKDDIIAFKKNHKLDNLTLYPFVPETELAQKIRECDIMLGIFTNTGTFQKVVPNKVFAGAATKKAVITADLPAIHDFFTHKHDIYLCQPEDAQSLANAITILSHDTKLRNTIANTSYQNFLDNLSIKQIANALDKELQTLLKKA